jgi:hypothetical protein
MMLGMDYPFSFAGGFLPVVEYVTGDLADAHRHRREVVRLEPESGEAI